MATKAKNETNSVTVTTEQVETMNLAQKISTIRRTVINFVKSATGYQYNYVDGSQALGKIKDAMDSLGVILVPELDYSTQSMQIIEIHSMKSFKAGFENNKQQFVDKEVVTRDYLVQMAMKYVWIDCATGERLEVPWALYGQQDEVSKAFGSGLTYSERYFILKFFNVPTDKDDPDARQKAPDYVPPLVVTTTNPARDAEVIADVAKAMGTTDVIINKPVPEVETNVLGGMVEPPVTSVPVGGVPAPTKGSKQDMINKLESILTSKQKADVFAGAKVKSLADLKPDDLTKLYGMVVK